MPDAQLYNIMKWSNAQSRDLFMKIIQSSVYHVKLCFIKEYVFHVMHKLS